jgi:hypothetical protein
MRVLTGLLINGPKGGRGIHVLLGIQGLMLFDAVVSVGLAWIAFGYIPGFWTSLLAIPFSIALFRLAVTDGYATLRSWLLTMGLALAVFVAMAVGLPRLGEFVSRCTSCA